MSSKRKKSNGAYGNLDAALSATYYFFQIEDWNWTLSFDVNESDDIDGPYFDYRQPEIKYDAHSQLSGRGASASICLFSMHALDNNDARTIHNSSCVGRLELKKRQ
jgi:hypothetical protein